MEPAGIALQPGDLFGALRLSRSLAVGPEAVLFLAEPAQPEERAHPCWLTVVAPGGEAAHRALLDSARRQETLDHPALRPIRDVVQDDGLVGLVCDAPAGVALRELLVEGEGMEPDDALDVIEQLVDGLAEVHRAGLVHGLLDPSQVWLTDGVMGVAVTLTGLGRGAARAALPGGGASAAPPSESLPYIAPELRGGDAAPTSTADIYALGALLHALLRGAPPALETDTRASLDTLLPGCPAEVAAAVAACLSTDPGDRPGSVAALAELLGLELAAAVRVDEPVVIDQGALQAAHSGRPWRRPRQRVDLPRIPASPPTEADTPVSASPQEHPVEDPAASLDPAEWEEDEPTEPSVDAARLTEASETPGGEPSAEGGARSGPVDPVVVRDGDMPAALAEVRARLAARDAARAAAPPPAATSTPRHRLLVVAALLLLVAGLVAGGAWFFLRDGGPRGRLADAAQPAVSAELAAAPPAAGG